MIANSPEPFFHRGPSPLAKLTFFSLLAVGIMIADHRFHAMSAVRQAVRSVLDPVELAIAMPGNALGQLGRYVSNQRQLLTENQALHQQVLNLSVAGQQAALQRAEYDHLLSLGQSLSHFGGAGTLAEIIRDARNPFARKVIVNKGSLHNILPGLVVIDGAAVVGQVTAAGSLTSEVTLITEKNQSVPVMALRNGWRMIAVGAGKDGTIDVPFIPVGADIQKGDVLVTSGIDGTYPPGLHVATISHVERNPAQSFAKITAIPASGVDSHRHVMILAALPTQSNSAPNASTLEARPVADMPAAPVKKTAP